MRGSAHLGAVGLWCRIMVLKLTFHGSGVLETEHAC